MHNDTLVSKRDRPKTAEQIRLAVAVAGAFIASSLTVSEDARPLALKAIEEVADLAACRAGVGVFIRHGIDLLTAVPADRIALQVFRDRRWPQVVAHVAERRERAIHADTTACGVAVVPWARCHGATEVSGFARCAQGGGGCVV